jgi:hypothetical protein
VKHSLSRCTIADDGALVLLSRASHCWDDVHVGARGQVCAEALTDACCPLPAYTLLDFSHFESFRLDVLRRNNSSYARQCSSASAVGRWVRCSKEQSVAVLQGAGRRTTLPHSTAVSRVVRGATVVTSLETRRFLHRSRTTATDGARARRREGCQVAAPATNGHVKLSADTKHDELGTMLSPQRATVNTRLWLFWVHFCNYCGLF